MSEPEVAVVFSPEPWVERLHRHCADHGGVRVRQILVEPELALEETYDVLVVSHRWPALTRALVDALHASGRSVLGVIDPAEPAGAEHLTGLGVDGVTDSGRSPRELVDAIRVVAAAGPTGSHASAREPGRAAGVGRRSTAPGRVLVVAGPAGAGKTETAVAFAAALHAQHAHCALVDVDEVAPSVGPRLGLPLGPNLLDAVDAAAHAPADLRSAFVAGPKGLPVVVGPASRAAWVHVRSGELVGLLDALARSFAWVVVDTGNRIEDVDVAGHPRYGCSRAALSRADVVVTVAEGTPNGMVRFLAALGDACALARGAPFHVVVNRGPVDRARRGELAHELTRSFVPASLTMTPYDARVETAAWAGAVVSAGPFHDALDRVVDLVVPGLRAARVRERAATGRRVHPPWTRSLLASGSRS